MLAAPAADTDLVYYEQPLSERMRAFLRLEYLFGRARCQVKGTDAFSSRATVETIIDILALIGRSDLKKELIKELERHAGTLEGLSRNPRVDVQRLDMILSRLRALLADLRASDSAPGQELRHNELLGAVRQRSSIPAGTCDFDLPAYHYWLRGSPEERSADLHRWLGRFDSLREAITLCLGLVRDSATGTRELAPSGFFQRTLDTNQPYQMLRVALAADAPWFPEISAGKHRFTIRFMHAASPETRAVQADEDVGFKLLCCVL
ncbi:MAG: cell division protein ZapD [Planctomycetes bacterium]|nr:cell division protein ZapD [Planctomycetota bacterium]